MSYDAQRILGLYILCASAATLLVAGLLRMGRRSRPSEDVSLGGIFLDPDLHGPQWPSNHAARRKTPASWYRDVDAACSAVNSGDELSRRREARR